MTVDMQNEMPQSVFNYPMMCADGKEHVVHCTALAFFDVGPTRIEIGLAESDGFIMKDEQMFYLRMYGPDGNKILVFMARPSLLAVAAAITGCISQFDYRELEKRQMQRRVN